MNLTPCPTCELPNYCVRARHCHKPTLESAIREVEEATRVMNAAIVRLDEATRSLEIARHMKEK